MRRRMTSHTMFFIWIHWSIHPFPPMYPWGGWLRITYLSIYKRMVTYLRLIWQAMVTYVFILEEVYLFTMYLFICLFIHLSFIIVTPTYPTHLFIYVGINIWKRGDGHPLVYLSGGWHPITCFLSIYLSIYEFAPQCIYEVDGCLSLIYPSMRGMATYLGLIWQEMATYVFILEEMTSHSIFYF